MKIQTKNIKIYLMAILFGVMGIWAVWHDVTVAAAHSNEQVSAKVSGAAQSARVESPSMTSGVNAASRKVYLPLIITSSAGNEWPMSGANPQRTSWTPEEVRGQLQPIWYRPIQPYISQKVQIIAADDMVYVSTSAGLYAFNAETGAQNWVFPTELPLGNSPTINNGVAYVGGYDHNLYALNALTGQELWTFQAGAGFDTNPLVVNGLVYLGNRDGSFYAIYDNDNPNRGTLAWKYTTGGPILYSAAYDQDSNTLYFASDDSYAYALNATTGQLVWQSAKLPGAGFHSWWPVIYQDKVIFSGSQDYRSNIDPYRGPLNALETNDVFPNNLTDPRGTLVGPRGQVAGNWAAGTVTIDASRVTQYFQNKPWRRTDFVLQKATGQEYTFDYNQDGKPEYAPIQWANTHSGNRYPPVVGQDNVLYQFNVYQSAPYIPAGSVSGWKVGTPFISVVSSWWEARDEPMAYSGGGRIIYWAMHNDLAAGAFDYTLPDTAFPNIDNSREWVYWDNNALTSLIPGFDVEYGGTAWYNGDPNGTYGLHGDQDAPIPYHGKLFLQRGNAIIALGSSTSGPTALSVAATVTVTRVSKTDLNTTQLEQTLTTEIQKMISAGHLRPGYLSTGLWDLQANSYDGSYLADYFHNPADTIYTLMRAYPYVDPSIQVSLTNYIKSEFANYPPCGTSNIGWANGASREAFDLPPEVEAARSTTSDYIAPLYPGFNPNCTPHSFYALWLYAKTFGGARTIFNQYSSQLQTPPADSVLTTYPEANNAFIAGYYGYLQLQSLAGSAPSTTISNTLQHLLQLRVSSFTQNNLARNALVDDYGVVLSVARNFMYLTPELGQYLHDHASSQIQNALNYYNTLAPYWFVSKAEEHGREGIIQPLYDVNALFQAQALVLKQPQSQLEKYLDVPAFARGDLFYIQNLVAAIEAQNN